MQHLSVAARLHRSHENILGRHEGQLRVNARLDDRRVDHKPVRDIVYDAQAGIRCQERLGRNDPLVG